MIIQTAAGPARVMHRLALAVEVLDAVTNRLADMPVRVGREITALLPARGRQPPDPSWPCHDLERSGLARFKLRRGPQLPSVITLRIEDAGPADYVPRRVSDHVVVTGRRRSSRPDSADRPLHSGGFALPAYLAVARVGVPAGPRHNCYPGPGAPRDRRGALSPDAPVRWPRITAIGPGNVPVGWAHGDERGEFVLPLTSAGIVPPLDGQFAVDIDVVGRPAAHGARSRSGGPLRRSGRRGRAALNCAADRSRSRQ